jgi:hypothetical protein
MGRSPIRRLARATGFRGVLRDAGAWYDRPRDRVGFSRLPSEGSVSDPLQAAPTPIRRDGVSRYLEGLAWLCIETSRNQTLLPIFIAIIKWFPKALWHARLAAA